MDEVSSRKKWERACSCSGGLIGVIGHFGRSRSGSKTSTASRRRRADRWMPSPGHRPGRELQESKSRTKLAQAGYF